MYSYELKKPKTTLKVILAIVITASVMFFIMQYMYENDASSKVNIQKLSAVTDNNTIDEDHSDINDNENIIENVMECVVGISMLKPDGASVFDVNATQKWGLGTGLIVSDKGYILTNQHLATNKNSKITVTLASGESVSGKIIWTEENIDLALIKIEKENLPRAFLADSDNLTIGEEVFAIGNPLGLEFQRTVTKGIISGLNRTLKLEENDKTSFMEDLIQTDASINLGNSGGPLINANGEVIGINTVKVTSAEGIGFAVPINIIKPILEKLENGEKFEEATLGIFAYDKEVIPYMNTKNKLNTGIYVVDIDKNGVSNSSGLKVGDIITKIDGVEINKMVELRKYIYSKKPGEEVVLDVTSGAREKKISIKLGRK